MLELDVGFCMPCTGKVNIGDCCVLFCFSE